MRHTYTTRALVLARRAVAEGSLECVLLTQELGLIRARAQGARKAGAKLAPALQTLAECDALVVRGREFWRLAGALPVENWFRGIPLPARPRAGRVVGLLLRLVAGEVADARLFDTVVGFLSALATLPETEHDAAETLAVLRLLAALGLDAGAIPEAGAYDRRALAQCGERRAVVARINRGIVASGL